MIKKYIAFFLMIVFAIACQKQQVELPLIGIAGITEIQNHSSIWIFYKSQNKDTLAILNKNNKILNTHWIFNVDKRLQMKDVIPHFKALQENRNKDSMHKKEGMLNYFSYADTTLEQISLTPFLPVTFIELEDDAAVQEEVQDQPLHVSVEISNDFIKLNDKIIVLEALEKEIALLGTGDSITKPVVRLIYNQNTQYQYYLQTKVYLSFNDIATLPMEYIFNVK
jgi:hypothetical protein